MNNTINQKLLDAVINNHFTIVKELLENGADPNYYEDRAQIRPLHFAALYDSPEVVSLLVMAGADLYATTECGETAMMIAIKHHHTKIIKTLRQFYGVQIDHVTKQ